MMTWPVCLYTGLCFLFWILSLHLPSHWSGFLSIPSFKPPIKRTINAEGHPLDVLSEEEDKEKEENEETGAIQTGEEIGTADVT